MSIADEVPFEIPETWEWCRCSSLGVMIRGHGIKRTETTFAGLPCIRYGEIYTSYNDEFHQAKSYISDELFSNCLLANKGDVLYTLTGENKKDIAKSVTYAGAASIAVGGDLALWTSHGMNPLYLVFYMASPYCISQKQRTATGDIIVHISTDKVGRFLIPVPPKAEQDRIVETICSIRKYIGEYNAIEEKLSALNTQFPDKLRKSILQLAVQGKLVPQAPNDEPASVLLERIRAEKERLIAEGKIKRDKHESIIYRRDNSHYELRDGVERCIDEEIPFEAPETWEWTRLQMVITLTSGQDYDSELFNDQGVGIPYITGASNIENGTVTLNRWTTMPKCIARNGDLLIVCKGAGVGKMAVLKVPDAHIARQIMGIHAYEISAGYLQIFLEYSLAMIRSKMQGVIPGISRDDVLNLLFPIPPLEEQNRIVNLEEQASNRILSLQQ